MRGGTKVPYTRVVLRPFTQGIKFMHRRKVAHRYESHSQCDGSHLTILEAIALPTTSCSIRLKCIQMGFTLPRSIEIGTSRVLRKLIPGRNVPPVTSSSTLVYLASTSPGMQWMNHCLVKTSQRLSIDRSDAVTHSTPTFTTSATLYDRIL